jgi:hypothetical protein
MAFEESPRFEGNQVVSPRSLRGWLHQHQRHLIVAVAIFVIIDLIIAGYFAAQTFFQGPPGGLDGCIALTDGTPLMATIRVGEQVRSTYGDGCFFFDELPAGVQELVIETGAGASATWTVEIISEQAVGLGVINADAAGLTRKPDEPAAAPTEIVADFMARYNEYHSTHGTWPRGWGNYRFTDIGLEPADWSGPVGGIIWTPEEDRFGLSNYPADNLQIYVTDLEGNVRKLHDDWNIWCVAAGGKCYFHTVAPENEVDINSLVVVQE